jgi:serine/threonine-protein kinase RsbT
VAYCMQMGFPGIYNMEETIHLHYEVPADDFTHAGSASGQVKTVLKQLGLPPDIIRRVTIAMYEGEINMVIHAKGGNAEVTITPEKIIIELIDIGLGIPDIDLAMQEGYSTAPDEIRSLGFGAGMGLPNMKKYTDELTIKTVIGEGTTVQIVVYIKAK